MLIRPKPWRPALQDQRTGGTRAAHAVHRHQHARQARAPNRPAGRWRWRGRRRRWRVAAAAGPSWLARLGPDGRNARRIMCAWRCLAASRMRPVRLGNILVRLECYKVKYNVNEVRAAAAGRRGEPPERARKGPSDCAAPAVGGASERASGPPRAATVGGPCRRGRRPRARSGSSARSSTSPAPPESTRHTPASSRRHAFEPLRRAPGPRPAGRGSRGRSAGSPPGRPEPGAVAPAREGLRAVRERKDGRAAGGERGGF